ncbi:MAG: hypothetical protein JWM82_2106 [Myxococcales bacterium]|nr:hypothetical protein [Myxococcales bacterium]
MAANAERLLAISDRVDEASAAPKALVRAVEEQRRDDVVPLARAWAQACRVVADFLTGKAPLADAWLRQATRAEAATSLDDLVTFTEHERRLIESDLARLTVASIANEGKSFESLRQNVTALAKAVVTNTKAKPPKDSN